MGISWWTIVLQAINFLVLVWLLQRFLYKPVTEVIARRRALVDESFASAEQARQAATAEQQRLEQSQAALAEQRQQLLSAAHEEIDADRARVLEQARQEAASMLETTRTRLAAEREAVLASTKEALADLASNMAARLLGDATSAASAGALNDAFLSQLAARVRSLPARERETLGRDLSADAEGVHVVTASPLSDDAQERWQRMLAEEFGVPVAARFSVDPALLGGALLRFPHAELDLSWGAALQRGRTALLADEDAG